MRTVALLLCLLFSTPAFSQGLDLEVSKASRDVLVKAAALGNMQFMENSQMNVRLYGFTVSGTCIPESHQVCGHHYVMLTSSFDEAPVIRAYDLGKVGEITKVEFQGSQAASPLMLEVTVQNYAEVALKSNPRLAKHTRKFRLKLTEERMELVKAKK